MEIQIAGTNGTGPSLSRQGRRSRVLVLVGTRPEAIKLAPVVKALRSRPERFDVRICLSSQHREMLRPFLSLFGVQADYDLDVMRPDQSPTSVAARVMEGLDPILAELEPDWVLVQGDTTTAMAAAIAAAYRRVCIGHVEAGLRTHDKAFPFPEELNRKVVGAVADLHFAPTEKARGHLLAEGVPDEDIRVTGNTVIDALMDVVASPYEPDRDQLDEVFRDERRLLLVTTHRRESMGAGMQGVCETLREIAGMYRESIRIVFPVHMNPRVRAAVYPILDGIENVSLIPPQDYFAFVHLMRRSHLILTDSGGVQEEAPSLGVPVLVLRDVSERMEATEAGVAKLVGTDPGRVMRETRRLLDDPEAHSDMARRANPYGDGHAAMRIADTLAAHPYGVGAFARVS